MQRNQCNICFKHESRPDVKSHLTLTAAKSIVKIASFEELAKWIPPKDIVKLSLVIQDPTYQVRQKFTSKLCKMIQMRQISYSFVALLPLIAHDPEVELKTMVSRFLSRFKQQNLGTGFLY